MKDAGYKASSDRGYNPKPIDMGAQVPGATPSQPLDPPDSNRKKGQGANHGGTVDTSPYQSVPNQVTGLPNPGNVTPNQKVR